MHTIDTGLQMPWKNGLKRPTWPDPWPPRTTGRTWRAWWSGAERLLPCSLMALMCQPLAVRCALTCPPTHFTSVSACGLTSVIIYCHKADVILDHLLITCQPFHAIALHASPAPLAGCHKGPCIAAHDAPPNACNAVYSLMLCMSCQASHAPHAVTCGL